MMFSVSRRINLCIEGMSLDIGGVLADWRHRDGNVARSVVGGVFIKLLAERLRKTA